MEYPGNYRVSESSLPQLPAQLHACCGAAGRAACHRPSDSDSPFRLRPNYAVSSGLYGQPASARRATARGGRKLSALLAALLFGASGAAQATIINAASPSYADVSSAVASAVDGDTVIVPSGSATWTSQFVISKAITLIGATTTDSVAGTAVDATVITADMPGTTSIPLITINSTAGKSYRISGFTFQDARTVRTLNGYINFNGLSQLVRIDHCHFTEMPEQNVYVIANGAVCGVADHNVIEHAFIVSQTVPFHAHNGNSDGGNLGQAAWSAPTNWGGSDFFFVEDNYIKSTSTTSVNSCMDGTQGGRFVLRHNHIYNDLVSAHGTEGAARGARAIEVYSNDFHNSLANTSGKIRSGNLLFWNNTYDGTALSSKTFGLQTQRVIGYWQSSSPWQTADGSSPWDVNDTEGNGTWVDGHTPHLYYPASGSATATGGSTTTLVSSGAGWTSNQWVNYGVKKTFSSDGSSLGAGNLILSNTSDTLTLFVNGYPASPTTWVAGDQYQIHKVLVVLDQTGRGPSDLITGTPPNFLNSVTGTKAWPHQPLDPAYGWNNTEGATAIKITGDLLGGGITFVENRDYYNQAAPVGGVQTTGVGIGTLANRPASGKNGVDIIGITPNPPGTAYWATDVPSINGSTDNGALYVWRGGAWVLYYQPYTYPHPLVSGVLSAPTNLRVVN